MSVPTNNTSSDLSNSQQVTLYIGPDRKAFTLNKELLCDKIGFLRVAFQGRFKERTEKTIDLPEEDPELFKRIIG